MKVAFFQPYLANWRIEFLNYFKSKYDFEAIIYDGGFSRGRDSKSINGKGECFEIKKLTSLSPILSFSNQEYPLYFSPTLFFRLVIDKPDVVITEGEINFLNNISIYLYSRLFNKKYIWWSLGKVRTRSKNKLNLLLDPIVNFLLKNASVVMARNSYAKNYYLNLKGIDKNKIIVAPNSMNGQKAIGEVSTTLVKQLTNYKEGITFLYVGGLVKSKRPKELILAFSRVINKKPATLWFVGDGPELPALKALVHELGLNNSVKFFGQIFDGVGSYFEAADVVVVPGLGGLVINHAMFFGKPVISGIADGTELDLIKDGITGYLLKDSSIESLISAMHKISSQEVIARMKPNVLELIDNRWNIELMYQRCTDCIELANESS